MSLPKLIHLSIQTCLKLEPLEFLLSLNNAIYCYRIEATSDVDRLLHGFTMNKNPSPVKDDSDGDDG